MDIFVPWDNCVNEAGVATLRCIPIVFQNIVTAALLFSGVVALIFIIISGYKFMTSGGDPKAVESARKTATYAIIGLVLILLSFAIVQFISISTGVKCINAFSFENCDTAPINSESIQDNTDIGNTTDRSSGAPLGADDINAPDSSSEEDKNGRDIRNSIRGGRDGGRTGSNKNDRNNNR
jgi:uncharacterized membrane protein